jgi:hypothetical protein
MTLTPPPPRFPELPDGVDPPGAYRWRPWHALTGLGLAIVTLLVLGATILALAELAGLDTGSPAANIAGLVVQDACFILAAVAAARLAGPVRARDFGLRRPPRWALWAVPPLWLLFPLVTFLWVSLLGADRRRAAFARGGMREVLADLVAATGTCRPGCRSAPS